MAPDCQIVDWLPGWSGCIGSKISTGGVPITNASLQVHTYYDQIAHIIRAQFHSDLAQSATYELMNVNGQIIAEGKQVIPAGNSTLSIPDAGFASGDYFLQITTDLFKGAAKVNIIK